jgi:3'-phosphoadenosine 5'-phosphosulfate sulfotransferase (PAPS reductase)/FAD synthetase
VGVPNPPSPYFITGLAAISFSGGRTSGYMLRKIVDAHGGTLPPDIIPIFANTGKEREDTLLFVHNFTAQWGIPVHWVEWRAEKPGFAVVDFASASRLGEPFGALIAKKGMPPNWQARFCTQFLKVKAMTALMGSLGYAPRSYKEVIGLRHDEGHRVLKMLERNDKDGRQCVAPLAKARVTVVDVAAFWRAQPFDLGLRSGEGNCDLCFLKGKGLRKELIRQRPASAEWWIAQEQSVNGFFDRRDSYSSLAAEVRESPGLFPPIEQEEQDVECGLLCAPE